MLRRILPLLLLAALCGEAKAQVPNNCGLQLGGPVAFCETFDTKNPGIPSRTYDLDPNVWGVSRATGDTRWTTTQVDACGSLTALSSKDVVICNGQLREATNDNHFVTVLAMYPKQPFDFFGRTGTVAFDVSNDTQGSHAAWPEFWVTDTPVPTPFSHFDSWISYPRNGLGIRFAANAEIGQGGICPNGNNLDKRRFTMDSAVVIRNYNFEDVLWNNTLLDGFPGSTGTTVSILDCVVASPGPNGPLNHFEIKITQNLIEVWASDAGSTALRKIATVNNPNLSFSRGLVWMQDAHYNASKGACVPNGGPNPVCQDQHTFAWDNLAFDGPFTYRDFSYDALDNSTVPDPTTGLMDIAKTAPPNQLTSWNVLNMPANPQPEAVRVLFNWRTYFNTVPGNLIVKVNGNQHTVPYPYPAGDAPCCGVGSWRTYPLTIPVTELVAGTNVVEIGSDVQNDSTLVANVNIVLVNVPGGVPVLPGSNNTYPAGGTAINGLCGSANGVPVSTAPSSNLCTAGTASAVGGTGPWTWTCAGLNGGTTANCSAPVATANVPTATLLANPTSITSGASATLTWSSTDATSCTASGGWSGTRATSGTLSVSPTITTTYTLVCTGNGGTSPASSVTVTVTPPSIVNGVCGPANGTESSLRPTSGLCSAGVLMGPVSCKCSVGGTWSWKCLGSNGGTNASCSAARP